MLFVAAKILVRLYLMSLDNLESELLSRDIKALVQHQGTGTLLSDQPLRPLAPNLSPLPRATANHQGRRYTATNCYPRRQLSTVPPFDGIWSSSVSVDENTRCCRVHRISFA